MSDIPALAPDRILRFHAPDKVFHSLNAITWFALLFTGMYVYFLNPSDEAAETAMLIHLILGAVFTFNLLGFIVIAPDRFALIMLGVGSQYDLLVPQLRWLSPPFLQDPVRSS